MIPSPTTLLLLFSEHVDHGIGEEVHAKRVERAGKDTGAKSKSRPIQAINGVPIGTFHFYNLLCMCRCNLDTFVGSGSINVFVFKCRSAPH